MRKVLKQIVENEMIRYLFFGGCTTAVNLGMFAILRYGVCLEIQIANLISILTSIIFAFLVNRSFVFHSAKTKMNEVLSEFLNFTGMRCMTLFVELWGVAALVNHMHISDFVSKVIIQIIVIILNYIISKCYVFREKAVKGGDT